MEKYKPAVFLMTFILLIIAIYWVLSSQIDNRINVEILKITNNPEFINNISKRIQIPFMIFDENSVIKFSSDNEKLINTINVKKDANNNISEIIIEPSKILNYPPIIQALNCSFEFAQPKSIAPYSWIYYPADTVIFLAIDTNDKPDPEKKLIKEFKLTIIQ